jgi:hypothetical protein
MVPLENSGFLLKNSGFLSELQSQVPTGHGTGNQVFYYNKNSGKVSIVGYNILGRVAGIPFLAYN